MNSQDEIERLQARVETLERENEWLRKLLESRSSELLRTLHSIDEEVREVARAVETDQAVARATA